MNIFGAQKSLIFIKSEMISVMSLTYVTNRFNYRVNSLTWIQVDYCNRANIKLLCTLFF